jgi:hypothetical protein
MKRQKLFEKGVSILLGVTLALTGISFGGKSEMRTVQAAQTTKKPSESTYAEMSDLKQSSARIRYGLYQESTKKPKIAQKVYFGKSLSAGDNSPQTWYIAGYDNEGLVLICDPENPFTSLKYRQHSNNITGDYGSESTPSDVYENNYGYSDLRAYLMGEALNAFSDAEKKLMLNTTVYTMDTKNNMIYSTSDKLYAAYGVLNNRYITVGANSADNLEGGIKIQIKENNVNAPAESPYAKYICSYWLRSPGEKVGGMCAGDVIKYSSDGYNIVGEANGLTRYVVPVFDLDLSSLKFASSAQAVTSATSFEDDNTMTFRFDGSTIIASTAAYTAKNVIVSKDAGDKNLFLYVQGNTGGKDWIYSQEVTESGMINVSNIHSGADLSNCKIWLETSDDNVVYAKTATASSLTEILSVEITLDAPTVGNALASAAYSDTTGLASDTPSVTYKTGTETAIGNAQYNKTYTAAISLQADSEHFFDGTLTTSVVKVNGENSKTVTLGNDGTLLVTYDFATPKEKLLSIKAPDSKEVENGTEKTVEAMGLPDAVAIVTEANSVTSANVTWDLDNLADNTTYDRTLLTEQTFKVNGTVGISEEIDTDNIPLTTQITITVTAAGVTAAPTADVASGTYTENQIISLTSSTPDAEIYYNVTTDETEPASPDSSSIKYIDSIAVDGSAGNTVTVKIKAIAVKNGMQDSAETALTYVIMIPEMTYAINVDGGTAQVDGKPAAVSESGKTVTITAAAPSNGEKFKEWQVVSGSVTLADASMTETTFSMPETAVELKAVYEEEHTENDHTGGTATCVSQALCESCGKPYGGVDLNNHTGKTDVVDKKEATCTEKGYTGDVICADCKTVLEKGEETIPTGHKGGTATYTSKAICDTCGKEYGEMLKDNDNQEVTEKPTTTEEKPSTQQPTTTEEEPSTQQPTTTEEEPSTPQPTAAEETANQEPPIKELNKKETIEQIWSVEKTEDSGTEEALAASVSSTEVTEVKAPKTGDTTNIPMTVFLMLISVINIAGCVMYNIRKKR